MLSARWVSLGFALVGLLSAAPAEEGYRPVAGPRPLLRAAALSHVSAKDWLAQKDLASLATTAPELELLARLLAAQGSSPDWQKGTAKLEDLARKLGPACRSKNAALAGELVRNYDDGLKTLEKVAPGEAKPQPAFKATGGVKTWMLAMDFAYNEAKSSKNAEATTDLAKVLAEQANALQFLKGDVRWRTYSQQVRDLALQAAEAKKPDEARTLLLKAFERCEACHQNKK